MEQKLLSWLGSNVGQKQQPTERRECF